MQDRSTTIYFSNDDDARDAMRELETSGYSNASMRLERADGEHESGTFMDKVKEFFGAAPPTDSSVNGVFLVIDRLDAEAVNVLRRYGGQFNEPPTGATDIASPTSRIATDATTGDTDEQRLRLHEERLQIEKEAQQQGEFRVRKEVVTETQQVDVPVSHDEIYVERRPVTGSDTGTDAATINEEGEIRIPLTREEVHVEKRPVTTEEIVVGKQRVTETQTVGADVRKERARIESDVDVDSANVRDKLNDNP